MTLGNAARAQLRLIIGCMAARRPHGVGLGLRYSRFSGFRRRSTRSRRRIRRAAVAVGFSRLAGDSRMRGESGYRSSSIVFRSSRTSASVSSSVRSGVAMTCMWGG
jgi:hypothetical protein